MNIASILLAISGILVGLLSGIMIDFSITIIPSLRTLTAEEHIKTMQVFNDKIKNLLFLSTFIGPALLLPLATYLYRDTVQFSLLVLASALHIILMVILTIIGNVPLNDRLEAVNLNSVSASEAKHIRTDYHGTWSMWMRLHHIRSITSLITLFIIFIVCISL